MRRAPAGRHRMIPPKPTYGIEEAVDNAAVYICNIAASLRNLLRHASEKLPHTAKIWLYRLMVMDMSLAGFRMSRKEWLALGEKTRLQYLRVLIETSPPRADGWAYEAYELSMEPTR